MDFGDEGDSYMEHWVNLTTILPNGQAHATHLHSASVCRHEDIRADAPELDLWILEMRVTAIWSIGLMNTGILMKTDGFW